MRRSVRALRGLSRAALTPTGPTRDRALAVAERLSALTTLHSSLEYLTQRRQTERGGLNDWSILRDTCQDTGPLLRGLLDLVSEPRATAAVHLGRAALAAALLAPGDGRWRGAAGLCLAVSGALLSPRHVFGAEGSDQVVALVQGATGAAGLVRSDAAKDALVWYVAAQANLAYATSGWVKLLGREWRDGTALSGVLRTRTYGHAGLWARARRHPGAARLLTRSVVALECGFPLLYTCGGRPARPVITAMVLFHSVNAHVMGLPRFLTAFGSMLPLVAYTAVPGSHPVGARRDDRVLPLLVTAAAVTVAGAATTAVRRRLTVLAGAPGSRRLVTGTGNLLRYEHHAEGEPDRPVVVFETGPAAPPEHFSRIVERLRQTSGLGLLGYARAGYDGSSRRAAGPYGLAESVRDLVDLVEAQVTGGRRVILAGHALGGEIVRRAAPLLGDRLEGVVYLDPGHPAGPPRPPRRSRDAGEHVSGLRRMAWFLRLGTGFLLSPPDWIGDLPRAARPRARAQFADSRMWWAAAREWEAAEREFRSGPGELPAAPGRALVVSARRTVDGDPGQPLFHRALVRAHLRGGACVVLEDAGRDDLLTRPAHALDIARLIAAFAAADRSGQPTEGVRT
ncbi:alpha/beta fold hydrolase [Streptomyces sp. NPDC001889]